MSTTPAAERGGEKAKARLRARKRINELKKRRKAKERKQRLKQTGEKSPAESPLATARAAALNETIMSRLDLSCFMKARRKGFAKAPPLENAYPAKYARFVSLLYLCFRLCLEYRETADVYYVSILFLNHFAKFICAFVLGATCT